MRGSDEPRRVLLLGEAGMLGQDLQSTAPPQNAVLTATHTLGGRFDITDRDSVIAALDVTRPHCIINAAAFTNVDNAEHETQRALAVNATALGFLGDQCVVRGLRIVHFSTDYVFPGDGHRPYREDDPVEPINAYGLTKLKGEKALAASGARALIVRTQWLFGRGGRSFPRTMRDRAKAGQPTRVVDDQVGRPTYSRDLAGWTWTLIERQAEGVIHAANAGPATWFDVAAHVFERLGTSHLLSRCSTADYPTPARRPQYSVLDTAKLEREVGAPRPWREALDEFLTELEAS